MYNPHVSRLIEAPWGFIVEGKRNDTESNAIVYIDPAQATPLEWHETSTEIITHHFGYGAIIIGNTAYELRTGREPIVLNPGEIYEIINLEKADLLSFSINVSPPFDPGDVHLVLSQV